jgi:alcohol dehydrogenase class IV
MKSFRLLQPSKIEFGSGCIERFVEDYIQTGLKRLMVITTPPVRPLSEPALEQLKQKGVEVTVYDRIMAEPTLNEFNAILDEARKLGIDSVTGIGGGSVLDVAKLLGAMVNSKQKVADCFGIGFIKERGVWTACIPTTAGTGSEVSPNAILLDEDDHLKKGVVSPFLVCNAVYIDPKLTLTVPAKVTAETGMDALSHCIESYTNKYAHPVVDSYALEGIKLIAANLKRAVENGKDLEAREALALGSYYGGLCLGPVNTAAVHALSYPLGGEYHISHGLSNAMLLPPVMAFNMSSDITKFANIARAFGLADQGSEEATAKAGIDFIEQLSKECGIPTKLSQIGITPDKVDELAAAAMKVTRLLGNNPREVTLADAKAIYQQLF